MPQYHLHRVLVGERRWPMATEERRREPDDVGEATASERLEAAHDRHHPNEAELLRFRLARASCVTLTLRGCKRERHRVPRAQAEPLRKGIVCDRLIGRFRVGEPTVDDLQFVGVEVIGLVPGEQQDIRKGHRVAPDCHGPGEQARTVRRHDLGEVSDLIEDLVGLRAASRGSPPRERRHTARNLG